MSILFLALRVLGVVLLAVLALAAVAMLLPAGLDIRWRRGGPLEVWLTAGPLRRKFFPFPEETPPGGKKNAAKVPDAAPSAAPKAPEPAEKSGGGPPPEVPPAPEPPQAETAAPAKPAAASPEEEFEAMLGKLMSDPMRHVRRGQQWAKGPGRFLLARLRVRHRMHRLDGDGAGCGRHRGDLRRADGRLQHRLGDPAGSCGRQSRRAAPGTGFYRRARRRTLFCLPNHGKNVYNSSNGAADHAGRRQTEGGAGAAQGSRQQISRPIKIPDIFPE